MPPVDHDKLRSHVDYVRGNLRRLEQLRESGRAQFLDDEVDPEGIWTIIEDDLGDFDAFIAAIAARYFKEPLNPQ